MNGNHKEEKTSLLVKPDAIGSDLFPGMVQSGGEEGQEKRGDNKKGAGEKKSFSYSGSN